MSEFTTMPISSPLTIAVIGLGYVGLPLLIELTKYHRTIGFDVDKAKVLDLSEKTDRTGETSESDLELLSTATLTSDPERIKDANVYIVTVPTPVDIDKKPDLTALKAATQHISKFLENGDLVIYESTVYPGATHEVCVPILEATGHRLNEHFYVGYSPERVVPGTGNKRLNQITKLISISDNSKMEMMRRVYSQITSEKLHEVNSIEAAEAAKIFENIQRDVNIGLINEFSNIAHALNINITEVLDACATKWNFLQFHPGMVGGHCIGVDPYYLIDKCNKNQIPLNITTSARHTNEHMPQAYVDKLCLQEEQIFDKSVLIIGYTFKENCNDCRNTKVLELYENLQHKAKKVCVYDPLVDLSTLTDNVDFVTDINNYDIYLIATWHDQFEKFEKAQIEKFKLESKIEIYSLRKIPNLKIANPL